jgi:hypothetical protein
MAFESGWLARVTFRATRGADEVVNTLHYDNDDSSTVFSTSMQELADRLRDDLMDGYRFFFPTDWTIEPVVVTQEKDPQDPDAAREQVTAGPGGAGTGTWTATGDQLPIEMCAMGSERTAKIGRSFRGRIFLPPGWVEGQLTTPGVWLDGATYFEHCEDWLGSIPLEPDLVTGPSGARCRLCVYSRTRRARDQDPYAEAVTSITLANTVRWLRSRRS